MSAISTMHAGVAGVSPVSPKNKNIYRCEVCNYSSPSWTTYDNHMHSMRHFRACERQAKECGGVLRARLPAGGSKDLTKPKESVVKTETETETETEEAEAETEETEAEDIDCDTETECGEDEDEDEDEDCVGAHWSSRRISNLLIDLNRSAVWRRANPPHPIYQADAIILSGMSFIAGVMTAFYFSEGGYNICQ